MYINRHSGSALPVRHAILGSHIVRKGGLLFRCVYESKNKGKSFHFLPNSFQYPSHIPPLFPAWGGGGGASVAMALFCKFCITTLCVTGCSDWSGVFVFNQSVNQSDFSLGDVVLDKMILIQYTYHTGIVLVQSMYFGWNSSVSGCSIICILYEYSSLDIPKPVNIILMSYFAVPNVVFISVSVMFIVLSCTKSTILVHTIYLSVNLRNSNEIRKTYEILVLNYVVSVHPKHVLSDHLT